MPSSTPLADRSAIVTGASSGMGRETAKVLARDGASVALAARREGRLRDLSATIETEFDAETLVVPTDVTEESAVRNLVGATVDRFGGLDVMVNIAGLSRGGSIEETSAADYREMIETNVSGTFFATKAALPHLRESAGNLILMSSYAGNFPYPRNPVYGGTRWWIRGFARSIEADAGADDVAVSVVNPAEVRTQVWEDTYDEGEISEPEEVAEAIGFIARQSELSTISELNFHHRSKLAGVF